MFSKKHKKVLLVTGSVAAGKSFICNQIDKENVSYIDLDKIVNLIYENNKDFKKKLLTIDPSFIENNKINKNNIKKAISENPKVLDLLEQNIYPILRNKLNLLLIKSKDLLCIVEVPLLFEKNFKVDISFRSINVFCSKVTHRKRLHSRFGKSKNLFKNTILKYIF